MARRDDCYMSLSESRPPVGERPMRECPACRGKRVPCLTCGGWRIVEGEPESSEEAARVELARRWWRRAGAR